MACQRGQQTIRATAGREEHQADDGAHHHHGQRPGQVAPAERVRGQAEVEVVVRRAEVREHEHARPGGGEARDDAPDPPRADVVRVARARVERERGGADPEQRPQRGADADERDVGALLGVRVDHARHPAADAPEDRHQGRLRPEGGAEDQRDQRDHQRLADVAVVELAVALVVDQGLLDADRVLAEVVPREPQEHGTHEHHGEDEEPGRGIDPETIGHRRPQQLLEAVHRPHEDDGDEPAEGPEHDRDGDGPWDVARAVAEHRLRLRFRVITVAGQGPRWYCAATAPKGRRDTSGCGGVSMELRGWGSNPRQSH